MQEGVCLFYHKQCGKNGKEVSSDERVFVSTKEVCEGFVCAFFGFLELLQNMYKSRRESI